MAAWTTVLDFLILRECKINIKNLNMDVRLIIIRKQGTFNQGRIRIFWGHQFSKLPGGKPGKLRVFETSDPVKTYSVESNT